MDDTTKSVPLNRAELGLLSSLLVENIVEGGTTYEIVTTGETADSMTVLQKLMEYTFMGKRTDAKPEP